MSAAPLHVTSMPDVLMDWVPSSVSASLGFMVMVSTVPSRQVSKLVTIVMHDSKESCSMTDLLFQ